MRVFLKRYGVTAIPFLFTLGTSIWSLSQVDLVNIPHYWLSAAATATFVCLPGSVAFGIYAALISSNKRKAMFYIRTSRRPFAQVIIRDLLPAFLAFTASYLLLFAFLGSQVGSASDQIPVSIFLLIPSISTSVLLFAYACGLVLPKPLALIASSLIPLVWAGYTVATPIFQLHYATGILFSDCCRVYTILDNSALSLTIALNILFSLTLIAVILIIGRRRELRSSVLIALFAFGIVGQYLALIFLGGGVGATPIIERDRSQLTCTGKLPTICLYPLQASSPEVVGGLRVSWNALKNLYTALPNKIVGGSPETNEVGVVITVSSSVSEVTYSLAADAIGTPATCSESEQNQTRRDQIYRLLQNLFLIQIDGKPSQTSTWKLPLSPSEVNTLRKLSSSPIEVQRLWVDKAISITRDCTDDPAIR